MRRKSVIYIPEIKSISRDRVTVEGYRPNELLFIKAVRWKNKNILEDMLTNSLTVIIYQKFAEKSI